MKRAMKYLAVAGSALFLMTACAQERDPIDRVQPNVVSKSFFVGKDLVDITDDPEFYMRGTVVDVGYGAAQDGLFTSTYAQQVSRIRWEITEDYLNARLAYERVAGSDGKGNQWDGLTKKTTNDGQIAASFRILSHFDISRSYNPTTGEELNVWEENASDRPWYEREYMRVDWSQNLATTAYDYDTLALIGIFGGVQYEPLSYTVTDPASEDAPVYDEEGGYMDVTNKAFAKPQLIDLSHLGWGIDSFPACMLPGEFAGGTDPYGNCNPVELTIRLAFKKVVDKDYEPKHVDGYRFSAFGMFDVNYRGYDRNYGMTDNKWFRFGTKYNIWERSHYYKDPEAMTGWVACGTTESTSTATGDPSSNANRDEDDNGTADECEEVTELTGVPGSQCDIFKQRCTLPYRLRKTVTIPWHVVDQARAELQLFDPINEATVEWDMAMKTAVQTARLVECIRSGADEDVCREQFPMWHGQQDDNVVAIRISKALDNCRRTKGWDNKECLTLVDSMAAEVAAARGDDSDTLAIAAVLKNNAPVVVACHSPVIASDHPVCGKEGTTSRFGDLRFNNVQVIGAPQTPSAWGIMVDADDPVTGEKVAASINVWDYVTDTAAASLVDQIRYANGEISTEQVTNGEYIHDWIAANALSNGGGVLATLDEDHIESGLAAAAGVSKEKMASIRKNGPTDELKAIAKNVKAQHGNVATKFDVASMNMIEASARMAGARGKSSEAALFNKAIVQLAGVNAAVASSGVMSNVVSPLAGNNPLVASRIRQMKENALSNRGACIMEGAPEPSSTLGLTKALLRKFPAVEGETDAQRVERNQKIADYIHRKYTYGTLVHEMGHSFGHRHNFVSSAAPLHFRPQYWQLRTHNGQVNTICDKAVSDGSKCVGPRYFDPVDQDEQDNIIMMFTQSSIMDYGGDVSLDFLGIGAYDIAAIRHHYADVVSMFDDKSIKETSSVGIGMLNNMDNFGGLFGIKYCAGSSRDCEDFHYSELQKRWNILRDCYEVTPEQPSWWKEDVDGIYDPLLDGLYVNMDGKYTECRQIPVDYAAWNDLRFPNAAAMDKLGYYQGGPSIDTLHRVRVPYSFATDSWADLGNSSVYRHDMGADTYEIAMFLISMYENRHIFENYRRGRSSFNVRSAAGRSWERYNEKLLGLATGIGFYSNVYKNFSAAQGYAYDDLWPSIIDWNLKDNVITAAVVFDHFVRQLSRPAAGPHYRLAAALDPSVLRSGEDPDGNFNESQTAVIIPNGSTGYLKDVGFGGRPLESAYAEDKGEYDNDYTMNCGSYYDKINVGILLSESEDRYVSSSRTDYYDARWRAAGMADVFPDGFRRVIANALTGDRSILAPVVAADASGNILLDTNTTNTLDADANLYPAKPIGWKSFWPETPEVCFSSMGRQVCRAQLSDANSDVDGSMFARDTVANTVAIDPQIGWEVQKFIIAYTLAYIPANSKTNWLEMMSVYKMGNHSDPGFTRRVEWTDPQSGVKFVARSYGKECLFGTGKDCVGGKIVEKGIAARVLEYANELTAKGYALDVDACPESESNGNGAGFNKFGMACVDTYSDGTPIVKADAGIIGITPDGYGDYVVQDCSKADFDLDKCKPLAISFNRAAWELENYKSIPNYIYQVMIDYGLSTAGGPIGFYGD